MIAIIPMKEHSERVPRKNLRDFNGKPLFYWIIDTLTKASTITGIVVNTDSLKIGNMVKQYFLGVKILYRPDYLKGDMVTANALIGWTLTKLKGEHFLYTHSTNPLLKPTTIDRGVTFYLDNLDRYDSLFGVTRHYFRLYTEDGKPLNHNPRELKRSQDLAPLFEDNSTMYIFSRKKYRIGERPKLFEVPKAEAIDIDTEEDWKIAEALMKCGDIF